MPRIMLYTGKGGVGKTSVAAATALACADRGLRTIVISTDSAHSLADSFDQPLGAEPTLIRPNLWGQEVDVIHQMRAIWGDLQGFFRDVMNWKGFDSVIADEMSILPGMEELSSLLLVTDFYKSGDYDVIIIDCAPTGETLRLLSFPETARWWLEKIFPLQRRGVALARPFLKAMTNIPVPDDAVFDAIYRLAKKVESMRELLIDPKVTSVRIVVNAEKMVVKEAQRSYTYLSLFGYLTDAIICNRLIPDSIDDPYFDAWKSTQARYFSMIEESFSGLPVFRAPLFDQELVGTAMLERMGKAIFGDADPAQLFRTEVVQRIVREDGHYRLTLLLPLVDRANVQLTSVTDELVVEIGNRRHNIFLPRTLSGRQPLSAKLEGNHLNVIFAGPDEDTAGGAPDGAAKAS